MVEFQYGMKSGISLSHLYPGIASNGIVADVQLNILLSKGLTHYECTKKLSSFCEEVLWASVGTVRRYLISDQK